MNTSDHSFSVWRFLLALCALVLCLPGPSAAALWLEIAPDPVNIFLEGGETNVNVSVIRHGSNPGDLNHNVWVDLGTTDTNVCTVYSPILMVAHPTAVAQTNLVQVDAWSAGTAQLGATATNYAGATNTVNVSTNPALILPATVNVDEGQSVQVTIQRQGAAANSVTVAVSRAVGDVRISVKGDGGVFTNSDTVLMPAGSNSAVFYVLGNVPTEPDYAEVTAEAPGYLSDTARVYVACTSGVMVVSVSSADINGMYYIGETIDISVTFSEAVWVGTPYILTATGPVTTNWYAFYNSGSGTDTIRFQYVVQPDDSSADLDYAATNALYANGVPITNSAGEVADLELPVPGAAGSLSWNKDISVDGSMGPDDDPDCDGSGNRDERLAGTDPDDQSSVFKMISVTNEPGGYRIEWQAVVGKSYTVKYTDDLLTSWTAPPAWQGIEGTNTLMSVIDDGSETGGLSSNRFYRVQLAQ